MSQHEASSKIAPFPEEFLLRDLCEHDWFWAQNELLDFFAARIGPDGVCVYLCLARDCRGKSSVARVSLRQIEAGWKVEGRNSTLGKSTIARCLALLSEIGMIRQIAKGSSIRPAEYGLVSLQKLAKRMGYDGVPPWDKDDRKQRTHKRVVPGWDNDQQPVRGAASRKGGQPL